MMEAKSMSPSLPKKKEGCDAHTPLKRDDCNIQYGAVSFNEEHIVALIDSNAETESKCVGLHTILTTLTIEPFFFCYMFASCLNSSNLTEMMMDKGCLYNLNYSKEICNNLSNHEKEKDKVEILANNYMLYWDLTNFLAAFMMIFIAPWSDKYGRKVPLLMSVFGAVLTDVGLLLCAIYFESRLEYLILARLPIEFTGGFICMLTIVFSHASETSSEKNRTLKYTSVEIAMGIGMTTGVLTGGFMYRHYGYTYIYATITILHVFCFVWTLFLVEETTGLNSNLEWHEKLKGFFSCQSFKNSIITTCSAREGNTRIILLLLLASMCTIVLNYDGKFMLIFSKYMLRRNIFTFLYILHEFQ